VVVGVSLSVDAGGIRRPGIRRAGIRRPSLKMGTAQIESCGGSMAGLCKGRGSHQGKRQPNMHYAADWLTEEQEFGVTIIRKPRRVLFSPQGFRPAGGIGRLGSA